MEAIAAVVRQHPKLMVLADEIYEYILFDGALVSFGTLPGMAERTITLNGFSKGFAMTGWRLGYAAASLPVAQSMARMQSILAITTSGDGPVKRADEIEGLLVEEMRRLGNTTMASWAERAEKRLAEQLQQQDDSAGVRKKKR